VTKQERARMILAIMLDASSPDPVQLRKALASFVRHEVRTGALYVNSRMHTALGKRVREARLFDGAHPVRDLIVQERAIMLSRPHVPSCVWSCSKPSGAWVSGTSCVCLDSKKEILMDRQTGKKNAGPTGKCSRCRRPVLHESQIASPLSCGCDKPLGPGRPIMLVSGEWRDSGENRGEKS